MAKYIVDLDLAQMAMIAGLPKALSRMNPITNPQAKRRLYVLNRMKNLDISVEKSSMWPQRVLSLPNGMDI